VWHLCSVPNLVQISVIVTDIVILSFCRQDNWRTRKRTCTKLGRHGQGMTLQKCWSGSACGFRITFSFSSLLRNGGFLDICYHFSYSQRPICTILGEMTDADKVMHPKHFETDPTDVRIRTRINPKILIRIPDHFCFKILALAEVCALWSLLLYWYDRWKYLLNCMYLLCFIWLRITARKPRKTECCNLMFCESFVYIY